MPAGRGGGGPIDAFGPAVDRGHLEAQRFEIGAHEPAQLPVVVDHQEAGTAGAVGHGGVVGSSSARRNCKPALSADVKRDGAAGSFGVGEGSRRGMRFTGRETRATRATDSA